MRDGISWQAVGDEAGDGSRDQIMKSMHRFYLLGQLFFTVICLWKEILESLVVQCTFFQSISTL